MAQKRLIRIDEIGKTMLDFAEDYEKRIRPFLARGDFDGASSAMSDVCSAYEGIANLADDFPSKRIYGAYQIAIIQLNGLLNVDIAGAKSFLRDSVCRQSLLNILDKSASVLNMGVLGVRACYPRG